MSHADDDGYGRLEKDAQRAIEYLGRSGKPCDGPTTAELVDYGDGVELVEILDRHGKVVAIMPVETFQAIRRDKELRNRAIPQNEP